MLKFFHLNLIATILIGTLLSSCNNKKDNFDIDLSNIKIPKKNTIKTSNIDDTDSAQEINELIKNQLKNYPEKSEVLSSVKLGKRDPFSGGGINGNKLTSDFKLTGFLNTENNKYVFVSYLDNEGTITEDSIGGVNTNLLPNGAKVINIDPKNMELTINFENENFYFRL